MTLDEPKEEILAPYWLRGAALLHQQCWCWGQDIRRPQGNLLIEYGFTLARPPEGLTSSSRYTLSRPDTRLTLWGFGIGYGCEPRGGIYVNRYCFVPRWLDDSFALDLIWQPAQLAGLRRPLTRREVRRSRQLLQSLMRWIASYERWVEGRHGLDYRRHTLAEWTRTSIPAERMAIEWELMARHVEEPPP